MSPRMAPATVAELSRVGLLAELPGEKLGELAAAMQREYVPAGTEIVREGEFGSRFYIVLAGLLSVTQDARGERALLRPGDYFGEVASVRAVTPATVASCDRATFDAFVKPLFTG